MTEAPRQIMGRKPVYTVPARTIINFDSGFKKKLLCSGPTFSTGSSCVYSCSFCYVPSTMKKLEFWHTKHGVDKRHEDVVIRRENPVEIARKQLKGRTEDDLAKRHMIYASPLVDVAANMDLVRETVDMCNLILKETCWDIRLLSKSNLLPKIAQMIPDDLRDARKRIVYGVSTGTFDDKVAAAFEEGCPLTSKRIESLHWLQDNGFRTFGMVCPSLPQPDWASYLHFATTASNLLRYDKCEHVWAEPINLRGESFTRTISALQAHGLQAEAELLNAVSNDKWLWEQYARDTFMAHHALCPTNKLRFLQYVSTAPQEYRKWWEERGLEKIGFATRATKGIVFL